MRPYPPPQPDGRAAVLFAWTYTNAAFYLLVWLSPSSRGGGGGGWVDALGGCLDSCMGGLLAARRPAVIYWSRFLSLYRLFQVLPPAPTSSAPLFPHAVSGVCWLPALSSSEELL